MTISRRALVGTASSLAFLRGAARAALPVVEVGAIRWDAWYSRRDNSAVAQNNLAPSDYRGRAPIHCRFNANQAFCEADQGVMDAEIRSASANGISFWAFDWFPIGSSFRSAWELYQSSTLRHLIRWCPILGLGDLGSASSAIAEMDAKAQKWVDLMSSASFYRLGVHPDRPLMFVFFRTEELKTYFKTLTALRNHLDRFRRMAIGSGVGEPYIVLFDPALDKQLFFDTGTDAISNYISASEPKVGGTFQDLDNQVRHYWNRMKNTGVPIVPIAQVGWDKRPRRDHPVPWEKSPPNPNSYYEIATPKEFYLHIKAAREFVQANSSICPSNVLLVYSWDECDEGGCIMPTIGDPEGKILAALSAALK